MAVKSSGSLSMKTDIVGEFGGTAPHGLKEYYRNGGNVPDASDNSSIPESGAIGFKDFYGAVNEVTLTSAATINGQSNRKQITVSDYIGSGEILVIPSNFWVWSDSTSTAALTIDIPCTIKNSGKIIGRGGNGASTAYSNGSAGGPAIKINSSVSGVTIINNSGAFIAGGGGGGAARQSGGGGGAGGGRGGNAGNGNYAGGSGGVLNASGGNGTSNTAYSNLDEFYYTASGGSGGGSGGGGGGNRYDKEGDINGGGGGGGGGRILAGTGGAGGVDTGNRSTRGANGGSAGNAGESYYAGGGGGGGWGASGGNSSYNGSSSGGAGGKAVEDSGNSYTLTNNGTIYGATT